MAGRLAPSVLVDQVEVKTAANAINAIQIKSHSARNIVIWAENHIERAHGCYDNTNQ